jgi:AcrR family transcriptional regulator
MRPLNEKLAMDILEAGKKEFLEKGYQGASMRNIAARLGVTTGALYRYYADKESIFDALVREPAETLEQKYREIQEQFGAQPIEQQINHLPEVSEEGHDWMIEYIYDHQDAFKLIACYAAGTKYEHYMDVLIDIEVKSSLVLIERLIGAGYHPEALHEDMVHMIASGLFNGMFEPVRHDMSREKAVVYMRILRKFYTAGWFEILGIS